MTAKAPSHLSKAAQGIFKGLVGEYGINDIAGLRILQAACESWDRATKARKEIDRTGMTVVDKAGQLKPHPLLTTERDNRAAFLQALKSLNLDLEPLKAGPGRPPGR